jgi:hypothetical protein
VQPALRGGHSLVANTFPLFSVWVDVSIRVPPLFAHANETAGFVQSMSTPADLVAGHKLDDGMGFVRPGMAFYL